MEASERDRIERLKKDVHCGRHMSCTYCELKRFSTGQYDVDVNCLECVSQDSSSCPHAETRGCLVFCSCPLRKYIVQNLGHWMAGSMERSWAGHEWLHS